MSERSHVRAKVSIDRQHEIRNEIAGLLCEFFGMPNMMGVASSVANYALEQMHFHVTEQWLIKESERAADYARANGRSVSIDRGIIDSVVVRTGPGPEDTYVFQNQEATNLLDNCPDFLNEEDYILWVSLGW